MKRLLIFMLFCLLVLSQGCSDNSVNKSDDSGITSYGLIESEPSINLDRDKVIIKSIDTASGEKSGIYSANIFNPIRTPEVILPDLDSPVKIKENLYAALSANSILLYSVEDSLSIDTIPGSFTSLAVLNDTFLVVTQNSGLYFVNINTGLSKVVADAYDPMTYRRDTISCIVQMTTNQFIIRKLSAELIHDENTDILFGSAVDIDTIFSPVPIRWVSIEPLANRYCFVRNDSVFAGSPNESNYRNVAIQYRDHPLILDYNLLIYPGPYGRLYQSDFQGVNKHPFWGAAN